MKLLMFLTDHILAVFFGLAIIFVMLKVTKREKQAAKAKASLVKAIKSGTNEPATLHPEIDSAMCVGCGGCTSVCPEGDILKLINHKAVLVSPSKCVGHGECEVACPMGAIELVFGTKTRGMDIPRISPNYETNIPGLYIAGELGGMGLIRNAIKQGKASAEHALKDLPSQSADYDVLVVGSGPAGLSASLVAIRDKKKYLCIDQQSLGGTVYNFPRQKVVMSHPFELPIVGTMKFASNKVSKEELLGYWNQVRKQTGFQVKEGTKFEGLKKEGNIFHVKTSKGDLTAKKVILAMGVRGSPRKLGVPGEDKPKVTYNLLDPEQYQNMSIIVVGGGNAGVESAQMLGQAKYKNKVHLLVRGKVFDRCNEDNIKRITKMASEGLVEICYETTVQEIKDKEIVIKKGEAVSTLPNHFVFVFAGAEMPHTFLMSLGINIDKKHGEGLSKAKKAS